MSAERQPRTIHTPWGSLTPAVHLAPLIYVLVLYGLVYFLPFGVFEAWTTGEDGVHSGHRPLVLSRTGSMTRSPGCKTFVVDRSERSERSVG